MIEKGLRSRCKVEMMVSRPRTPLRWLPFFRKMELYTLYNIINTLKVCSVSFWNEYVKFTSIRFIERCKAVENFCAESRRDYYTTTQYLYV
jgi:hypothetical protein